MLVLNSLKDLDVYPLRKSTRNNYQPYLSLGFNSGHHIFSIDTTRFPKKEPQPTAYLITHAHSDHHGRSTMLTENALASIETARALEILYGRRYVGKTFILEKEEVVKDTKIKTFPTYHTIGSTAFYWENEVGTRILVTGDVKDSSALPRCDVLVTEANYGDPMDPKCHFIDDYLGFEDAIEESVAFGAYAFGKAQRAVKILRDFEYGGDINMEETSLAITRGLTQGLEPLGALDGEGSLCIVPPSQLQNLPKSYKKYVLSGRDNPRYSTIHISDHMNASGLLRMIKQCMPKVVIVYHPGGDRPKKLASYLNKMGIPAITLADINSDSSKRGRIDRYQ